MSSLLEEAIIDAKALKEAALKNAETAVLEKYSNEVKTAITTLLEQDNPLDMDMGDPVLGDDLGGLGEGPLDVEEALDEPTADVDFLEETPYAFQDENLDAPNVGEIVEIDFNQLKEKLVAEEELGEETNPADLLPSEVVAEELGGLGDVSPLDMENASDEQPVDEYLDLSEEMVNSLVNELLEIDAEDVPQGWSSMNSAANPTEQRNSDDIAAAKEAHPIEEDEDDASADIVPLYESKIKNLKLTVTELKGLLQDAKVHLKSLNLANAKLVYQNKALGSTSLNERQKTQIVDAVACAKTVEETRILFETIQNAVGSTPVQRTRPQTLREAVSRPTSMLLSAQKETKATVDPRMDRMLRLAGLD